LYWEDDLLRERETRNMKEGFEKTEKQRRELFRFGSNEIEFGFEPKKHETNIFLLKGLCD